jgi:hypothetical protein
MDACPPLSPFYTFLTPHPLACADWTCRRPIRWREVDARGVWCGWCHEHRLRGAAVPVTIYGEEGAGWCSYPLDVRRYAHLADLGAFDERGRTRPFDEWRVRCDARRSLPPHGPLVGAAGAGARAGVGLSRSRAGLARGAALAVPGASVDARADDAARAMGGRQMFAAIERWLAAWVYRWQRRFFPSPVSAEWLATFRRRRES